MKTSNLHKLGSACFVVLAFASTGCAHTGALKEAAAADLNCDPRRVHILNSGKTRDVEACGQRATYHWEDGDWRMIGRGGPAGSPYGQPMQPMQAAPRSGPQPVFVQPQQPPPVQTAQPAPSQPARPAMPPSQPPPENGAPGRNL